MSYDIRRDREGTSVTIIFRPSYNAPAPAPSYNAPSPAPSYNGGGNNGGGKGGGKGGLFNINFKTIQLPVPDISIPNPLEFKTGVLRSKGRIASGILHAKAGLLRAGANILAQKANKLDQAAQAIPAMSTTMIKTLQVNIDMHDSEK